MWLLRDNNWVLPAGVLVIAAMGFLLLAPDDEAGNIPASGSARQKTVMGSQQVSPDAVAGRSTSTAGTASSIQQSGISSKGDNRYRDVVVSRDGYMSPLQSRGRYRQTGNGFSQITDSDNRYEQYDGVTDQAPGPVAGNAAPATGRTFISTNAAAGGNTSTDNSSPGNNIIPGIEDMDATTALAEVRNLIVNDGVGGLLDLMGAQPFSRDGNVLGYRINPPEGVYLDSIGIQPGDIIMEINGVALNNPDNINSVITGLLFSTSVEMKIERDGIIETVKR